MINRALVLETWDSLKGKVSNLRYFKESTNRMNVINYDNFQREEELRKKGKNTLINNLNQVKNKLEDLKNNYLSPEKDYVLIDGLDTTIELLNVRYLTSQIQGVEYFEDFF